MYLLCAPHSHMFPENIDGEDFPPTFEVMKLCHEAMLPQPSIIQLDGLPCGLYKPNHKVYFIVVFHSPHYVHMQDFSVCHLIPIYIKNVHNHSAAVSSAWKSPRVQYERCY